MHGFCVFAQTEGYVAEVAPYICDEGFLVRTYARATPVAAAGGHACILGRGRALCCEGKDSGDHNGKAPHLGVCMTMWDVCVVGRHTCVAVGCSQLKFASHPYC